LARHGFGGPGHFGSAGFVLGGVEDEDHSAGLVDDGRRLGAPLE